MSAAPKQIPARAPQKRFFILPVQSFTEELGERISAARRCCKLTQEELAQKSRTSLSTYKRIEQGDTTVSIGTVLSVLYCLDNLESCEGILAEVLQASHSANQLPQRVRHKSGPPKRPLVAKRKSHALKQKLSFVTAKSQVRSRTASDALTGASLCMEASSAKSSCRNPSEPDARHR